MQKVILYDLIRVTPGRFHGWYNSNVGVIRKPLGQFLTPLPKIAKAPVEKIVRMTAVAKKKWWVRAWNNIKRLLKR